MLSSAPASPPASLTAGPPRTFIRGFCTRRCLGRSVGLVGSVVGETGEQWHGRDQQQDSGRYAQHAHPPGASGASFAEVGHGRR